MAKPQTGFGNKLTTARNGVATIFIFQGTTNSKWKTRIPYIAWPSKCKCLVQVFHIYTNEE